MTTARREQNNSEENEFLCYQQQINFAYLSLIYLSKVLSTALSWKSEPRKYSQGTKRNKWL